MKSHAPRQPRRRKGAILSMELVLVLPVFLLVLFAIVEFTLLTSARMRLANAARIGVRRICLANATDDAVRSDVVRTLGPMLAANADIQVTSPEQSGELANVRIVMPMQNATPDLLWPTGFSVKGRILVADAPMVREHDVASVDHSDSEQL